MKRVAELPENSLTTPFKYQGSAHMDIKIRPVHDGKRGVALAISKLPSNVLISRKPTFSPSWRRPPRPLPLSTPLARSAPKDLSLSVPILNSSSTVCEKLEDYCWLKSYSSKITLYPISSLSSTCL